jgi:hypothetical protein
MLFVCILIELSIDYLLLLFVVGFQTCPLYNAFSVKYL